VSDANVIRELTESARRWVLLQVMRTASGRWSTPSAPRTQIRSNGFLANSRSSSAASGSAIGFAAKSACCSAWSCAVPLEVELPDPREFAQLTAKITSDEELVERLANALRSGTPRASRPSCQNSRLSASATCSATGSALFTTGSYARSCAVPNALIDCISG
jgi:hypothetical protein